MKLTRFFALLLCLLLCLSPVRGEGLAAEETPDNGSPYYIMVNRLMNTVTIFSLGEDGMYSVPCKAMVCSTGRYYNSTPLGNYTLTSYKTEWNGMQDGTYAQYVSQFKGNLLFHSICYSRADPSTMLAEEYAALGSPASRGCVRLQVADAKWIFDNCPAGTRVTIYESEDPGPLGKPQTLLPEIPAELENGWDPSDPREENPWRSILVQSLSIPEGDLSLEVGDAAVLTLNSFPEGAWLPEEVLWQADDPSILRVEADGSVLALAPGTTAVRVRQGYAECSVTVSVTGEVLPFTDVQPGAWFYRDVRSAYALGLMRGAGEGLFLPQGPVTRAMGMQIVFNLSGTPAAGERQPWYREALDWASELGLTRGMGTGAFSPDRPLTRQEFALLLYRYASAYAPGFRPASADLSLFTDADRIFFFAEEAMSWAVGIGLLKGTDAGELRPDGQLTRAQLAVILVRYRSVCG